MTRPARSAGTGRAAGLVLTAVLVAVGCSFAGSWQYERHLERVAYADVIQANDAAAPTPLSALVPRADAPLADDDVWRASRVTGTYQPGQVLLRSRPSPSGPAFHVLALLRLADPGGALDGAVLVVDRGWLPPGANAASPAAVPDPPAGEVDVLVRLRAAEPASGRPAPAGQVHRINPGEVVAVAEGAIGRTPTETMPTGTTQGAPAGVVVHAYGALEVEDPAAAQRPFPLEPPRTDLGSHRAYAFQWWIFALGALVGFGYLAYRELRPRADGPGHRPRRPTAEEEEDALIDAQLAQPAPRGEAGAVRRA